MGPLVFKTSGAALGAARWVRLPRVPATAQGGDTILASDKDWEPFYRAMVGRATRPMFDRTLALWGDRAPGRAIDLGAGDGTETLVLLERGWHVLAIDSAAGSARIIGARVAPSLAERLDLETAALDDAQLPPADLIYAGYSLPFQVPAAFERTWAAIRAALMPGGILAVNVFGPRDTWSTDPSMTFLDREATERLADGLEILGFEEQDEDGEAVSGPKHWHVFDLIARRPVRVGGGP